jgi:hypothetical protein
MTDETVGQSTEWSGNYKFRLVPILSIEMAQLASDPAYAQNARDVLEYWIAVENRNLARMMVNIRGWEMPANYETNRMPHGGRISQWLGRPSQELLNNSVRDLSGHLEVLARQLHDTGYRVAAVETAMLFRRLTKDFPAAFPSHVPAGGMLTYIAMSLNNSLGKNSYVFEGLDALQTLVESAISPAPPTPCLPPVTIGPAQSAPGGPAQDTPGAAGNEARSDDPRTME